MVNLHAKRTAAKWRDDRDAASETEARLRRSKFDNIDINAEVFVQARASFEMFDRLTQLAQTRRIGLLREISLRREFARRAIGKAGQFVIFAPCAKCGPGDDLRS